MNIQRIIFRVSRFSSKPSLNPSFKSFKTLQPITRFPVISKSINSNIRFYTDKSCNEPLKTFDQSQFTLSNAEKFKYLVDNDKLFLIDVRTPKEVSAGRVPSKKYINIPVNQVYESLQLSCEDFKDVFGVDKPSKDDDSLVIMCRTSRRSLNALKMFHELGYNKSKYFTPGWEEWNKEFPNEKI